MENADGTDEAQTTDKPSSTKDADVTDVAQTADK